MNIGLFRHAFVLLLLALLGGLLIPVMAIPRLGLSAHSIGVISAALLMGVGTLWAHFQLTTAQAFWLKWSWLYCSYVNWFACLVGGWLGAGQMTPLAAAGQRGSEVAELLTAALFVSVAVSSLVAVLLSLWGLRRQP